MNFYLTCVCKSLSSLHLIRKCSCTWSCAWKNNRELWKWFWFRSVGILANEEQSTLGWLYQGGRCLSVENRRDQSSLRWRLTFRSCAPLTSSHHLFACSFRHSPTLFLRLKVPPGFDLACFFTFSFPQLVFPNKAPQSYQPSHLSSEMPSVTPFHTPSLLFSHPPLDSNWLLHFSYTVCTETLYTFQ